jgi:hypothetical protein
VWESDDDDYERKQSNSIIRTNFLKHNDYISTPVLTARIPCIFSHIILTCLYNSETALAPEQSNGGAVCLLRGRKWIFSYYLDEVRPLNG